MSWSGDTSQVQVGDNVYGSEGDKVGTVAEVQGTYLVVEKGFFFPTDYYVPVASIASASSDGVYLNVTKDIALNSGWDTIPDTTSTAGWSAGTDVVETDVLRTAETGVVATPSTGVADTTTPRMAGYEATSEDDLVIPVREEELTATVRETEAGAARIEKRVVSEDRVLEVPVTEEQIRVERRVVDRAADAADADAFEEIVIEVPLTAEEVELRKQARVAEEVVVSKEAVQHTEQVRGTVRREEVDVVDGVTTTDLIDETDTRA